MVYRAVAIATSLMGSFYFALAASTSFSCVLSLILNQFRDVYLIAMMRCSPSQFIHLLYVWPLARLS